MTKSENSSPTPSNFAPLQPMLSIMKPSLSSTSCAPRLLSLLCASLLTTTASAAVLPFIPDASGAAAPLFDPDSGTLLSPATGGNVMVLRNEQLTINTTTGAISKSGTDAFSGTGDTGTTEDGANGSKEIALFTFNHLFIQKGGRVEITGTRAVGFIARKIIAVDGRVSVSRASAGGTGVELAGYAGGAAVAVMGDSSPGLPGDGVPGFGGTVGGGGGRTYTDAR
jgi:hypothetical protein